jgi:hypothetical protein
MASGILWHAAKHPQDRLAKYWAQSPKKCNVYRFIGFSILVSFSMAVSGAIRERCLIRGNPNFR